MIAWLDLQSASEELQALLPDETPDYLRFSANMIISNGLIEIAERLNLILQAEPWEHE